MPSSRSLAADLGDVLVSLYRGIETRLSADLARALASGLDSPDWAARKLQAFGKHRAQVLRMLAVAEREMPGRVDQALMLAYVRGAEEGLRELGRLGRRRRQSRFAAALARLTGLTRRRDRAAQAELDAIRAELPGLGAIQRLAFALVSQLRGTHLRILRWDLDAYRQVVARSSVDVLAGVATRQRATRIAWEQLLGQGITGFVDKAGRRWRLESYVEMAVRSTVAQAAVQAHLDTLRADGVDLVIVSDAPQECALCRPWEGKVLAIDRPLGARVVEAEHGIHDGQMVAVKVAGTVAEAIAAGLMHPNCRHTISAYLPGVTRIPTDTADPAGDKARQQLRALERQVRHWKRRQVAALDDTSRRTASVKVRGYQAQIRAHVAATGLIRQPHREQIWDSHRPSTVE